MYFRSYVLNEGHVNQLIFNCPTRYVNEFISLCILFRKFKIKGKNETEAVI